MTKRRYSISQMSEISNISKKALRFYDDLGLIESKRHGANNYRYYTQEDLLAVPPLKYYKQMGFHLGEIREAFELGSNTSLTALRKIFMKKIEGLQEEERTLHLRLTSVRDWLELLHEAEMVLENGLHSVSVKYVQPDDLLFHDQTFSSDIKSAIINLEFTNYVESVSNSITGPVMIRFSSIEDRIKDEPQNVQILQKTILPCQPEETQPYGGFLAACCYHIGEHGAIRDTYRKIQRWCASNNYICDQGSYERYVTDFWTTNHEELFVTEVLVKVSRPGNVRSLMAKAD
ncbi:MAG: MerR family transcriptional regulator [Desulfovibrio desulfuricans]|uniref:Transcriptional regulator, MerR family n=1 Tax=Desulfovibrio desulfuricans (strain ATCC 27774 / DSM 6949 / MB) TaxID=525146 RepID=B8J0H7_DESDA|nr:MerR family transcriptional regulator [uncultured Desulfovibrio sp.]MDY0202808.1 MerR family transcriptional regulator [Desulfovibrio desulfuricans]